MRIGPGAPSGLAKGSRAGVIAKGAFWHVIDLFWHVLAGASSGDFPLFSTSWSESRPKDPLQAVKGGVCEGIDSKGVILVFRISYCFSVRGSL